MERPFAVVEFNENNKVFASVVSTKWLTDDNRVCAWPVGIGSHQKLLAHAIPDGSWPTYPCCVLKFCATYEKAKKSRSKAQTDKKLESSEVESTLRPIAHRHKRSRPAKSRRRKKLQHSSDSDLERVSGSDSSSGSDLTLPENPLYLGSKSGEACDRNPSVTDGPPQSSNSAGDFTITDTTLRHPTGDVSPHSVSHSADGYDNSENTPPIDSTALQPPTVIEIIPDAISLQDFLQTVNSENEDLHTKIFAKLVEINDHLLEVLRRTAPAHEESVDTDIVTPKYPLTSVAEFDTFNEWLENLEHMKHMTNKLRFLGGRDDDNVVCRIIEQLITSEFAKVITLTSKGKYAQRGLKGTKLQELLYASVRLNKEQAELKDFPIDIFTQKWLKNAKHRNGGRENRSKSKCTKSTPANGHGGGVV